MSTVAMRSGGQAPGFGDERSSRGAAWWVGMAVAVGLVLFLLAWLLGWIRFTTDPRVQEILQLQEEAQKKYMANGGPQNLAEATEAMASMSVIRQKMESLPEPLREQVSRSGGSMFRSMMRAQINAYFAAPPEQRKALLDRQIKQEEMMRKAYEAARAAGSFFGGGPGGGAGQGGGANGQGGQTSANQQAGSAASPDEARNAWRKRIIDSTTPEQRARYVEYRRAMDVRRNELGLPANSWGR